MNKVGTAYVLWLGGLVGLAGLHRLYNGKIWTGLLWLFSGGLFGVGQLADLLFIPKMVETHNTKRASRLNASPVGEPGIHYVVEMSESKSSLDLGQSQALIQLLQAAAEHNGRLSVTQGVMATGLGFSAIEALLQGMVRTGYVEVGNDPETGVVVYEFKEL
ncbi:NINE protein [Phormidesmis priestleyi ULC007]|uniref:NINE protein n=1 Tax=Phormidesmis priestleyi ULC007 TaxID=1920490 RepID=A0A2T1D7S9_9CYAN|nr:NINE protein [Phormidesmis priestleyi]PSB16565.1 NINE protein [Phormidesmis priestleyi ULC007]PZO47418.1 MAG: NINE protein [Phormidesmis priestleyi]